MKYAALKYRDSRNIGDEIQTIAAIQFLPHVDMFVDRDHLGEQLIDDYTKLICNGWFMINPYNWPPPSFIMPLFISFHITHQHDCLQFFAKREYVEYFKEHEPIGCRDRWTLDFLDSLGIKAYLSGCLTLTLDRSFAPVDRTQKIYFVDVFSELGQERQKKYINLLVPDDQKDNVEIITHWYPNNKLDHEQKMTLAKELLSKYASAKLVITSRLHCLLPCLAFRTPVYFMDTGFNGKLQRNRFSGLLEFGNTLSMRDLYLPENRILRKLVSGTSIDKNLLSYARKKIDWYRATEQEVDHKLELIRNNLAKEVERFINARE